MTTKNFPHPLMLTAALLFLAAPVRPVQDDDLTKLTRALEMLGPVTPEWIMQTQPGILTVLDKDKRLYQLKVLGQQGCECSLHGTRNCFYLLKLFTGTRAEFKTTYDQMVDEKSYETFTENFGKKAGSCGLFKMTTAVVTQKVEEGALPEGSQDIIKKITELEYYGGKVTKSLSSEGKQSEHSSSRAQYNFMVKIKKLIPNMELGFDDPLAIAGTTAICSKTPSTKLFYDLAENQNYSFCIALGVATICGHATTLLVTKQNGVISFIFADSANVATYSLPAINVAIDFANDPVRLENALIRAEFYEQQRSFPMRWNNLDHKHLKQNNLFKSIYYPAFKERYEALKLTYESDIKLAEESTYADKDEFIEHSLTRIRKIEKLLEDLDPSKG